LDRIAAAHAKTLATVDRSQVKSGTPDIGHRKVTLLRENETTVIAD